MVCTREGCTKGACFDGATPVSTPTGLVRIDALRVDDVVLARDPESGASAAKRVLAVMQRPNPGIVRVRVQGDDGRRESIATTYEHPFWVATRERFVPAGELAPGDRLDALDAAHGATVVSLAGEPALHALVYNLSVADFHTYFVGESPVLVHNQYGVHGGASSGWTASEVSALINDFSLNKSFATVDKKNRFYDEKLRDQLLWNTTPKVQAFGGGGGGFGTYGGTNGGSGGSGASGMGGGISNFGCAKGSGMSGYGTGGMGAGLGGGGNYGFPGPSKPVVVDLRDFELYNRTLWQIVQSPTASPEARQKAFSALVDPWSRQGPCSAGAGDLIAHAFASDDPIIRGQAARLYAPAPYSADKLQAIYDKRVSAALKESEKPGGDPTLRRFADARRALAMVNDPNYGKNVNEALLRRDLARMQQDPALQRQTAEMWNAAVNEVKSSPEFRAQVGWMQTDTFMDQFELDPRVFKGELAKVMMVDPKAAADITRAVEANAARRAVERAGPDAYLALSEQNQGRVVDLLYGMVNNDDPTVIKPTKMAADVNKRIAKLLSEAVKLQNTTGNTGNFTKALNTMVNEPGTTPQVRKFANWLIVMEKAGKISALSGALSLLAATREDPQSRYYTLNVLMSVGKGIDAADGYLKLANHLRGTKVTDVKTLWNKKACGASLVRYLKVLGPSADAAGVYVDYDKAMRAAERGEVTVAYLDLAAAGFGIANVAAGGMLAIYGFAGVACPPAAVIMLIATLGYITVKGIREKLVDPDDIAWLKKVGWWQDARDTPGLGPGGAAMQVPNGVRVVNPGTSGLRKDGVISSVFLREPGGRPARYRVVTASDLDGVMRRAREKGLIVDSVEYK